jgi:hypothetical protein
MAKRLIEAGTGMIVIGVLLILSNWFGGSSPINPHVILWPGFILALAGYLLGGRKNT